MDSYVKMLKRHKIKFWQITNIYHNFLFHHDYLIYHKFGSDRMKTEGGVAF